MSQTLHHIINMAEKNTNKIFLNITNTNTPLDALNHVMVLVLPLIRSV